MQFEGITKCFPGVKALDDVSFSVRRGEVHVLLGENGAGKSTLIKILTGVYPQDEGRILLDGKEIRPGNTLESRALGIGTVFQENSLLPHLSVAENVFLTREIRNRLGGIDWKKTYAECRRWTQELGIDIDPRKRVGKLSVAEQQIVEIVKIFSQQPSVVILDEPTSALSDNEIDNLFAIVERMRQKGITFIYISHRMEEIKRIGNSGTVLRDGKKVGSLEDVRHADMEMVVKMIVGRTLEEKFPKRHVEIGEVCMEVENLSIPGVIYDVGFAVRKGEVLGLSGLVGSGRTSTAKAIIGAIPKERGTLRLNGREVKISSPSDAIKCGIGYLPEDRKAEGLILNKSVKENITLPSLLKIKSFGILSRKKENSCVTQYKEKLNIKTPGIDRLVKYLSGGNQQKVVFSKWLFAQTGVYIFDEPTRGIDVGSKSEIYRMINDLAASGAAVVVISSELPEILGICDRIVVMHEGRITGELDRAEATQERIMFYAIGGKHDVA